MDAELVQDNDLPEWVAGVSQSPNIQVENERRPREMKGHEHLRSLDYWRDLAKRKQVENKRLRQQAAMMRQVLVKVRSNGEWEIAEIDAALAATEISS